MVAHNEGRFKTTSHKFKLSFMANTRVQQINCESFPKNAYQFVPFYQINDGHPTNLLIDVIDHIVQKDEIKVNSKNNNTTKRIELVLEDLEKNQMSCTLWNHYAEDLEEYMSKQPVNGSVVIVILQFCMIRIFNGNVGICSYYETTKMLLNDDTKEVQAYRSQLDASEISITQLLNQPSTDSNISVTDDMLQTQRMTIAEIVECSEKFQTSVMAKVIEIDFARGWFYESCTHCFKKVQDIGGKWLCEGKNCMWIVIPVRRYMINLNVINASGSTNFVMFDRVAVKHFGKSVTDFTKLNQVGLDDELPHDIDLLVDKVFLFKVEGGGGNNKFK